MINTKGGSPPFLSALSALDQSSPNHVAVGSNGVQFNAPSPLSSASPRDIEGSESSQVSELPPSINGDALILYARSPASAVESRKNTLPKCIKRCSLIREEENEEGSASDGGCDNESQLTGSSRGVNGVLTTEPSQNLGPVTAPSGGRKPMAGAGDVRGSVDKLSTNTELLSNGDRRSEIAMAKSADLVQRASLPKITLLSDATHPIHEPRRNPGRAGAPKLSLVMPVVGNSANVNTAIVALSTNSSRPQTKLSGLAVPERSLRKVVSSPQLKMLNQICEEEDDMEREKEDEEEVIYGGGSGDRNRMYVGGAVPMGLDWTQQQKLPPTGRKSVNDVDALSDRHVGGSRQEEKQRPVSVKSHSVTRPLSSSKTVKLRDLNQVVSDTESEVVYHGGSVSAERSAARHAERVSKLRRFSVGERNAPSAGDRKKHAEVDMEIGEKMRRFSTGERKRSVDVRNGIWMKKEEEFSKGYNSATMEKANADILEVTKRTTWNSCGDLSLDSHDLNFQGMERDKGNGGGLHSHYTHGCALASELRQRRSEGMAVVEAVNRARRTSLRGGTIRFRAREFGSLVDKFSSSEISGGDREETLEREGVSS